MSPKRMRPRSVKEDQASEARATPPTYEGFRIHEANLRAALQRLESNYAQLERTQGQLRAIIDATPDALLFLTPDGRPVKVNRRFTDYFGLDDATVLSQTSEQLMDLLKTLFVSSEALKQSPIWSTTNAEQVFQESLIQVSPSRREFDCTSLPVLNIDQTYLGRLYAWHDMTHEREVDRLKDTVTAMVSHELRSPLTCISGYLDLLLEEKMAKTLTEEQRECLLRAQSEAQWMLCLTNDLLDLSRLDTGTIEWH